MKALLAGAGAIVWSVVLVAQTEVRQFAISGHGAVSLSVPVTWADRVQKSDRGLPPTYELTDTKTGTKVLITPLWSPTDDPQFTTRENIRVAVTRAARHAQSSAAESELVLRDIETSSGHGYYFWATDRAPKPGGYEFMANGVVPAGKLLLSFTVLTHERPPDSIEEPLAIVRSATHARTAG